MFLFWVGVGWIDKNLVHIINMNQIFAFSSDNTYFFYSKRGMIF